jgi:hypothetical protein
VAPCAPSSPLPFSVSFQWDSLLLEPHNKVTPFFFGMSQRWVQQLNPILRAQGQEGQQKGDPVDGDFLEEEDEGQHTSWRAWLDAQPDREKKKAELLECYKYDARLLDWETTAEGGEERRFLDGDLVEKSVHTVAQRLEAESGGWFEASGATHKRNDEADLKLSSECWGFKAVFFWLLKRSRVALMAIPCSALLLFVRYLLWSFGFIGITVLDSTIVPPIITLAAFVMGQVLHNVMQDYKESEKIPADFVAYFQTLTSFCITESACHEFDHRPILLEVENMLLAVLGTIDRAAEFEQCLADFSAAQTSYLQKLHHNGVQVLLDPEHALTEIVKKWTRIHDIGRLSIILPAYTLMDLICAALTGVLLCAQYSKNFEYSSYWVVGIFGFLIYYLNFLVRSALHPCLPPHAKAPQSHASLQPTLHPTISRLPENHTLPPPSPPLSSGLDDPFDGPKFFHFRCYAFGEELSMSALDTFWYGTSIDFACLTVHFGKQLRAALHKTREELLQEREAKSKRFRREGSRYAELLRQYRPEGGSKASALHGTHDPNPLVAGAHGGAFHREHNRALAEPQQQQQPQQVLQQPPPSPLRAPPPRSGQPGASQPVVAVNPFVNSSLAKDYQGSILGGLGAVVRGPGS